MLKKIPVGRVTIGMFFVRPEGSWLDHGLWVSKFLIRDAQQLASVRECGVSHVWINTGKGRDVEEAAVAVASAAPAPAPAPAAARTAPAVSLAPAPVLAPAAVAAAPAAGANLPRPKAPTVAQPPAAEGAPAINRPRAPSVADELPQARQVFGEAKQVVQETLSRAGEGVPPDLDACRTVVSPMVESVLRNASALTTLIRLRNQDDYSYMHSLSVSVLMIVLGRELGYDSKQCLEVGLAGLLHDVGKALVPGDLLNKPDRLTEQEFAEVKSHPRRGHRLLVDGGVTDAAALDVCLHHHERPDGHGYPERLAGSALTQWARMGAICDVYDAVTSDRSYKKAWDPAYSLAQMASWKGQFDRALLASFILGVGVYPIGSLVRLSSGKLAIVIESRPGLGRTPVVRVFHCLKAREPVTLRTVDLAAPGVSEGIVGVESREDWSGLNLSLLLTGGTDS
ncbi:MAG TPA: HD-GYP domain-containing protein [Burkholderiaceae bacterium]|nr:HD-GYP domain-containing protein [Burkholderiaceae bacterium]